MMSLVEAKRRLSAVPFATHYTFEVEGEVRGHAVSPKDVHV